MPLLLKNNQILLVRDYSTLVIKELEDNLFVNHYYLRDKIIRVSFRGLEPQAAVSAFKRYYEYVDDIDCVRWSDSSTTVSMTVVFTVLYTYIKQVIRTNNVNAFFKTFFAREDDGIRFLPDKNLVRSEAADAVASGFEQKSFQSFLRKLPYREYNELLIPVFRFGDDELVSRVSEEILCGCSDEDDEMFFRKSVLNKLLSLSDTDQAAVWHDAIIYGMDDETTALRTHKVSMFTYEYPDIELIEVTDDMGNERSESEYFSDRYKDTKGFRGIITYVTENKKMHILYYDGSVKLVTSPVKEHTICTMSDGSTAHMVVTENSIYRFKEIKKPEISFDQEEEEW